jgi:hypothetical protein
MPTLFIFYPFADMCPSGINTVANCPGIPEVICSVEEYFQTRDGDFSNVTQFCLIIISVSLPGVVSLNSKSFGSVSFNVDFLGGWY